LLAFSQLHLLFLAAWCEPQQMNHLSTIGGSGVMMTIMTITTMIIMTITANF
jgi:hypothetical protein